MRKRFHGLAEKGRVAQPVGHLPATKYGDTFGFFLLKGPFGEVLRVIASDAVDPIAQGWEHVSVTVVRDRNSLPRCPTWWPGGG